MQQMPTFFCLGSVDFLGGSEPIDRPLGELQVVDDFPDRHDSARA